MIYNEIISNLREIARDGLRLKMTSAVRTEINSLDNSKLNVAKEIEHAKLCIAVCDFEASEIKDNDPRKEDKLKNIVQNKEYAVKRLEDLEKELKRYDDAITEEMAQVAKIQAGEIKVSKESLEDETNRLIKVVTEEVAKKVQAN